MIEMKQQAPRPDFQQDELVTWHNYEGKKCIPVPGVVVRLELQNVVVRTRVQGKVQEVLVSPEQLAHR